MSIINCLPACDTRQGTPSADGTFTVVPSGTYLSPVITHQLHSQKIMGVIWAVPTGRTLVVPSGYCLIRGSFCNMNPFLEEAGVRNIDLDATGYSLATEPENLNDKKCTLAGLKSPWSSQSVAQSTSSVGLYDVTDDSFKLDLRSNCFFQAGVTYYWKVWVVA